MNALNWLIQIAHKNGLKFPRLDAELLVNTQPLRLPSELLDLLKPKRRTERQLKINWSEEGF